MKSEECQSEHFLLFVVHSSLFTLLIIQPAKILLGKINLPGDKSISHRAAMLAAMANGQTRIENFASSADCAATLQCLRDLGVEIERENSTVIVRGVGKNGFRQANKSLDCENSGTTMRLLCGILAGQNFDSILIGDKSLMKRPMRRVIEPLARMNARIESNDGCAPLTVRGKNPLTAKFNFSETASAQVKSAVLLAALNADGKTIYTEKAATRDHTERMLEWFGVELVRNKTEIGREIWLDANQELTARDLQIPADISSAAFFLVAAACLPNSEIVVENVGLNPTRTAIIKVLQNLGAKIEIENEREVCNEPIGNLLARGGLSSKIADGANVLRGEIIANLIDELPILAIFGTQLENGLEVRDARELRVKESDRIAATVENLRRMNARVTEFDDGFKVEKSDLTGAQIDSFGDHRIAMAFAIAALFATGETEIVGADAVKVSFPEFFSVLNEIIPS